MSPNVYFNLFRLLPRELRAEIFKELSQREILVASLVCRFFREIAGYRELWEDFRQRYLSRFSFVPNVSCQTQIACILENIRLGRGVRRQLFPHHNRLFEYETIERISSQEEATCSRPLCTPFYYLGLDRTFLFAVTESRLKVLRQVDASSSFELQQEIDLTHLGDTYFGYNDQFFVMGTDLESVICWTRTSEGLKVPHEVLHQGPLEISSLCCQSHYLFVGLRNGTVKSWTLKEGVFKENPHVLPCHREGVHYIDFDGDRLMTASNRQIKIWKCKGESKMVLQQKISLRCRKCWINSMVMTGSRLIIQTNPCRHFKIWNLEAGQKHHLKLDRTNLFDLDPYCAGPPNLLFTCQGVYRMRNKRSFDRTESPQNIQLFRQIRNFFNGGVFENLRDFKSLGEDRISALTYDGGYLVIGGADGRLTLIDFLNLPASVK